MQYLLQAHVDFPARTPQSKRWRRNGPLGCRRLTAGVSAQEVRHSIRNLVLGGAGAAVRSRRRTSTCARFDGRTSPIRDSATRPASFSLSRRPRTCACSRRRSRAVSSRKTRSGPRSAGGRIPEAKLPLHRVSALSLVVERLHRWREALTHLPPVACPFSQRALLPLIPLQTYLSNVGGRSTNDGHSLSVNCTPPHLGRTGIPSGSSDRFVANVSHVWFSAGA
jgi:hypothetical protein